ncbi:MAG: hypothetical protein RL414_734 [Actinomycetota bacterium]|jgi:hypothetical protein
MTTLDFWESKVLKSLDPVVKNSTLLKVNESKIVEVANWMAYEEFPKPDGSMLFDYGNDPDFLMDLTLVVNTMNFAFTDFATGVKYETDYNGRRYSDSEAMMADLHRAIEKKIPFFDGAYLAKMTRKDFEEVFCGNIELPMLDERISLFNEVGEVLVSQYQGKFHNFVRDCSPRLYDGGNGLLERLTKEFPRFNDVSMYNGHEIQIFKLAQLGIWGMHLALKPRGAWDLEDAHLITAFADYIVPVGMRVTGIFEYSPELEKQINSLIEVPRDSIAEIEIRANSIYAIARLTDEINARRPGMEPLLMPQVDFRFWKTYHATHWPHHLTKTVMY